MSFTIILSFESSTYLASRQNRWRLSNWNLLLLHLHYSRSYYIHIYISFHHIGQFVTFGFAKSFCMGCLVIFNEIFSLTSQKGDSIAYVDYLKLKNDVIHCNTIISDKTQNHAASNFLLLSCWIASYVTITCYTLLHQTTRGEGKNSLRGRRDIFVSDRDPQGIFCLNPSSYIIFSLRKLKLYWGRGPDNPKTH